MLIAMMIVDNLKLPILAGVQIWPAQHLGAQYPKLAVTWLMALAPLYWAGELSWLIVTVWFTRTRGLQSSALLWPFFIFMGWSFALYPVAKAAKAMGKGSIMVSVMTLIWVVLLATSFFVIKGTQRYKISMRYTTTTFSILNPRPC